MHGAFIFERPSSIFCGASLSEIPGDSVPSFSQTYGHSFPQTLSFDRLSQNTGGRGSTHLLVRAHLCSFSPLSSLKECSSHTMVYSGDSPLLKTVCLLLTTAFLTPLDATLTETPFANSFAYHPYEKSRVVGGPCYPGQPLRRAALRPILKIPLP